MDFIIYTNIFNEINFLLILFSLFLKLFLKTFHMNAIKSTSLLYFSRKNEKKAIKPDESARMFFKKSTTLRTRKKAFKILNKT